MRHNDLLAHMRFKLATSQMTDDLDDAEREDMAERRDNVASRMTSAQIPEAQRRAAVQLTPVPVGPPAAHR